VDFLDFRAGHTLHPGPGIELRTAPLNHPNGATGYRVSFAGKSICYITDTEHRPGVPDENILALIAGADDDSHRFGGRYPTDVYHRFASI